VQRQHRETQHNFTLKSITSLPRGLRGGRRELKAEGGGAGGSSVFRSGNNVVMPTLIPLETEIHVRRTSTQISPPPLPSNC